MDTVVDWLNSLNDELEESSAFIIEQRKENRQLRKQVAEYEMILRQHEFAEKEGFE